MKKKSIIARRDRRRAAKEALCIYRTSFRHCGLKRSGIYKLTTHQGERVKRAWNFCKRCHLVWFVPCVIESFRIGGGEPLLTAACTDEPNATGSFAAKGCKLERSTDGGKTYQPVEPTMNMSFDKYVKDLFALGVHAEITFEPRQRDEPPSL